MFSLSKLKLISNILWVSWVELYIAANFLDCVVEAFEDTSAAAPENGSQSKSKKDYTWTQENDNVTIVFPLADRVKKGDILFEIKTKWIKLGLKNGETLLEGELFGDVEADSCAWTIETQRCVLMKCLFNHLVWS